jgi:hypothetical protein
MIIHAYHLKKNFGDFDMSIFDVIKYPDIDIQSKEDLSQLPKEVIEKWHARLVEHACQSAETIAYQDESGKCQEGIDATRAYMRNEISIDDLNLAATMVSPEYANNANTYAYTAARAAYKAAHYEAYTAYTACTYNAADAAYFAARHDADADAYFEARHDADADAAYNSSIKLYKDWIMEELLAYEGEDIGI